MLPEVRLIRDYREDWTPGTARLPSGILIKTLELPWLNNAINKSCYPEGDYICKWLERSASGKYKRVWHVQNVPGRTGILWHAGNYLRNTNGCTLPGMSHGDRAVWQSGKALNLMRSELGGRDFLLAVRGNKAEQLPAKCNYK